MFVVDVMIVEVMMVVMDGNVGVGVCVNGWIGEMGMDLIVCMKMWLWCLLEIVVVVGVV